MQGFHVWHLKLVLLQTEERLRNLQATSLRAKSVVISGKVTELNIIAEQMQTAIAENSRTALDQNEYERRYADLTERYNTIKADYDKISEQIESKKAQRELFKGFIRALEKQGALVEEFDEGLWSSLVQEVVANAKDDIRFIFKNGFEIKTR